MVIFDHDLIVKYLLMLNLIVKIMTNQEQTQVLRRNLNFRPLVHF